MVTTGDDSPLKIWDCLPKSDTQTFEGHMSIVPFAGYQLCLPVIAIVSKDSRDHHLDPGRGVGQI